MSSAARRGLAAGVVLWLVAAIVAYRGQSLANPSQPELARWWLVAAAVLGLLAVRLLERTQPTAWVMPADAAEPAETIRSPLGLALVSGGGGLSVAATAMLAAHLPDALATAVWAIGVVVMLVGASRLSRPAEPRARAGRRPRPEQWLVLAGIVGILGLALWLRGPDLATVPPDVHGDEGDVGLLAREVIAGRMPLVFGSAPAGEASALTFTIHAATMRLVGDDLFGLRVASALEGVLSVLVLFLLVRRLFGPRPALLAATLLAIAAWHIHFSRIGIHYMQSAVAAPLALYFLVRAVQDRRALDWALCGCALGVCMQVYYAARLAPVLVVIYLGYRALRERGFLRAHLPGMLLLAYASLVFLAPMTTVWGARRDSFAARAAAVLVTSPNNLQHQYQGYHVSTLPEVLAIQTQRSLEAFNILGETSLEYGHAGLPMFDFFTVALLAMGALAVLARFGSATGMLLAAWFWLALLLGSVLTTDALFSPHLTVAIPVLVLVPALLIDRLWTGVGQLAGRVGVLACTLPVVALLGLALQANLHDYFVVHIQERRPAGAFTLVSQYVNAVNEHYRVYMIGRDGWTLTYATPHFLVPQPDAVDVRAQPLLLPLSDLPPTKGAAFVVDNGFELAGARLAALRQVYPAGAETVVYERAGVVAFTTYQVDRAALVAAGGHG